MTVSDDEFARLFQYIEDFRAEVREGLASKSDKKDVERIIGVLDGVAKKLGDHDVEMAALVDTSRRHEDSIETLANKLKVKLNTAKA